MNPAVSIKDLKDHKTGFYTAEVFPVMPFSRVYTIKGVAKTERNSVNQFPREGLKI